MSALESKSVSRIRVARKTGPRISSIVFENLVRAITALVLLLLVFILGTIIYQGAPKLSWEFLTSFPRDGMLAGGIFPALFGTVFVVLFMILMALPLGIFGAVYMVEYSRGGIASRVIRAAVNNLAGVPSIVFGLFGLGFFVLFVGRNLDHYARGVPRNEAELAVYAETHKAEMQTIGPPKKLFGQGAMFWAAATLAILVLPVIIVSTEESLRTVPASMREAAYALGATKWQMISTVVLPQARTGILTGAILAVARGAGELAPILFVGVTYFLPTLPLTEPVNFGLFHIPVINPFMPFMHLNYHIYSMATQESDQAAARPVEFATTLVLIAMTFLMNLAAIILRRRLTRKP
ncbi:phosphate ABC transporter permease PstA [soil metagenome]